MLKINSDCCYQTVSEVVLNEISPDSSRRRKLSCWAVAEVFTADRHVWEPFREWLAISSRINTWLFSLFRQTKQPFWNPNRLASPKFNLVFACGYIAKRQHHQRSSSHFSSTAVLALALVAFAVLSYMPSSQRGSYLKARTSAHVCIHTIHGPTSPISLVSTAPSSWPSIRPSESQTLLFFAPGLRLPSHISTLNSQTPKNNNIFVLPLNNENSISSE